MSRTSGYKFGRDESKPHAPTGKELSEAIGIVLKDYEGPVDTSIITKKLQAEHPLWKLPERRVNKFVKRVMGKHKNPAGADDDQTASMYKQSPSKRGFLGIFSPSKRTNLVTDPEVIQEKESTEASPTAAPQEDPVSPVKEEEETPASPEKEIVEAPSKDIAYETDNSVVEGSQDCWGLSCSIM
ncbi:hypothetical protein IV203_026709 [Nitzschia inconspicua]|uniref:Uncharacterized protein n=1 Tax=Nitzschia inconspicua TaxID=303405 RepID=A0A9K3LJ39_9STRA|nr:hypothetical protein IV203_026709 [Nitzschia inconspicua]